jgi:hypothetical protein
MFPHDTAYPIEVESGIQLNMSDRQFPGSLCTLMIDFQAAIDHPLNYLVRNEFLKLVKKHLGIRKKFKSIYEYEKKPPKKACPVFITNYLEEFMLTLSHFVKFGDPIYVTDIPAYHSFLNATHNCSYYLGRMNDILNFNKYEAFIEEPLDITIVPDTVEEVDVILLYKLGQGKVIYIKAETFQNTFYLLPLTVKIRIIRKANQYQYHYYRVLEENFRLRDVILMYPTERLIMLHPRFCRIAWYHLVYDTIRTANAPNIDLMNFPHLIQNLPLVIDVNPDDPSAFPLFTEAEGKNRGDV